MAKRKLSSAEKRKKRAKRLVPKPVTGKPVNFEKKPVEDDDSEPPPTERAKKLLHAQRTSVAMLTLVRERVEELDYDAIQKSLSSSGYHVVDGFLQNDDIVTELQEEGLSLLKKDLMEVDLDHLGSGEYVCKIEGGEEQYQSCPRSVELVVSTTKHMAPAFDNLDGSVCMAIMRTYDHKAQMASLQLLKNVPERPMDILAKEENDVRRLNLLYYPISPQWQGEGGVTLESGERIQAKRDRLVFLKSDTCVHRKEPWLGKDGLEHASCIELHLIAGGAEK